MWSDSLLKIEGWGSGGAGRRIPYFTGSAGPGQSCLRQNRPHAADLHVGSKGICLRKQVASLSQYIIENNNSCWKEYLIEPEVTHSRYIMLNSCTQFPWHIEMEFNGNINAELDMFMCVYLLGQQDEKVIWLVMLHIIHYHE